MGSPRFAAGLAGRPTSRGRADVSRLGPSARPRRAPCGGRLGSWMPLGDLGRNRRSIAANSNSRPSAGVQRCRACRRPRRLILPGSSTLVLAHAGAWPASRTVSVDIDAAAIVAAIRASLVVGMGRAGTVVWLGAAAGGPTAQSLSRPCASAHARSSVHGQGA